MKILWISDLFQYLTRVEPLFTSVDFIPEMTAEYRRLRSQDPIIIQHISDMILICMWSILTKYNFKGSKSCISLWSIVSIPCTLTFVNWQILWVMSNKSTLGHDNPQAVLTIKINRILQPERTRDHCSGQTRLTTHLLHIHTTSAADRVSTPRKLVNIFLHLPIKPHMRLKKIEKETLWNCYQSIITFQLYLHIISENTQCLTFWNLRGPSTQTVLNTPLFLLFCYPRPQIN